jgi:hypothetical protein
MTFDLNITFGGMCLLVKEADGGVRVLMPPVGRGGHTPGGHEDHGETNVHRHDVNLVYARGHASPGGQEAHELAPPPHDFANRQIDLSGIEGSPSIKQNDLMNFSDLSLRVNPELLVPKPDARVMSQVVFAAGSLTDCDKGGRWMIGADGPRHLAISFTWTIPGIEGESLIVPVTALRNGGADRELRLYPMEFDGQSAINLYIYNVTEDERIACLPPRRSDRNVPGHDEYCKPAPDENDVPVEGYRAKHFAAFYSLLAPALSDPPLPVFKDLGVQKAGREDVGRMGTKVTCVAGQAAA